MFGGVVEAAACECEQSSGLDVVGAADGCKDQVFSTKLRWRYSLLFYFSVSMMVFALETSSKTTGSSRTFYILTARWLCLKRTAETNSHCLQQSVS